VRQGRLAREFSERVMENLSKQTEEGRAASEQLADQARRQGEAGSEFARASVDAYLGFLGTAFSQYQVGAQRTVENAQERGRVASQTATGAVGATTDAAADATRTAAEAVTAQPPIGGYDEMTVDEVARRLEGLSGEELGRVREYERRNKNRTTLLERIDRKADEAS
jgi:hypothetical protein